ncbi:MAG: hypothetical protein SCH98_02430 [Deferrisomatales bacterium]|nr:hypothetical protein [Deferrisomatales bacterium]
MRAFVPLAVGTVLFLAGAASAAQTGGLASPLGPGGFATSVTLGYGERDVKDGRRDEVVTRRVLLRGQVGVTDGVDVYGTVGLGDLDFDRADFSGSLGETFGAGVRLGLLSFPESAIKLVLDLQGEYLRSTDGGKRVRHQAYHAATYVVREVGAARRVGYFFPYGGVRVSYARYDGNRGVPDTEGDDYVGVFGGADYFVNPNVFFTGELHLFDETGLYLGVGYRF